MKTDSIVRVGVAVVLFAIVALLLGVIVFSAPQGDVSGWSLIWRLVISFVCLGILYYILSFGQRRKEAELGYVWRVGPGEYRILSFCVFPDDFPDAKTDDKFMRHYAGIYFVVVGISTIAKSDCEPIQLLRLPRVGQNEVRRWFNEPSQYRKTLVVDSEKPSSCELMGGAFSPLTCAIRMDADPSSF